MVFPSILSKLYSLPLYGPQGHLEAFRQSVVNREEGWVWPTFGARRIWGGTCFQILRIQLTFPLAKATCFHFLSHLSPPMPPTWSTPLTPMPCLPFELPGTPGHSIWAAGPLCRCTGCRLSSWRGKREVCWPLPKTGSTHRLCSIWLLDFPNQEGCFIPGKRSTPMPTVNLPWILFVSRSIKLKR